MRREMNQRLMERQVEEAEKKHRRAMLASNKDSRSASATGRSVSQSDLGSSGFHHFLCIFRAGCEVGDCRGRNITRTSLTRVCIASSCCHDVDVWTGIGPQTKSHSLDCQ